MRFRSGRWFALVVACALVLGAAAPSRSEARPHYLKAIWGDVTHDGVSQFPLYKQLGVDLFQYPLRWNEVAPTRPADPRNPNDPAYHWPADLDQAVSEGTRDGIGVLTRVSMTPPWANGGQAAIDAPTNASDYADFMVAVARRYPQVHYFMVEEEPVRSMVYGLHASPSAPRPLTMTPALKADDAHYAQLVDATYSSLKQVNRRNKIIGGNSVSASDIDPRDWIHWLRLPNGKPPRMDYYGHNPFSARKPDPRKHQVRPSSADFSDFDVLEKWIDRWLVRDGRNRRLPIFISEYANPTQVPSFQFNWHLTLGAQASYLRAAMGIARADPRIAALGVYALRDLPADASGRESRVGLITQSGQHKPAFAVFAR